MAQFRRPQVSIQPCQNVSFQGSSASVNNNKWSTEDLIKAARQLPIRLEKLDQENKELNQENKELNQENKGLKQEIQRLRESKDSHSHEKGQLLAETQRVKQRYAAMAERRLNMDQRRTENTLSANRQSDLEKEYKNDFRDGRRVDAIDAIETKLNKTRRTKQLNVDDQLKAYRLACFIFEISYECSLRARDTFLTFYSSLLDTLVTDAPTIGSLDAKYRKLNDFKPSRISKAVTEESSSEVMVHVKEAAGRHNLDILVKMTRKEIKEKWREQYKAENLPSYDKNVKKELKGYIEYCTRFAWRLVTQVPPLKIDYKSSTYNSANHNESQAFSSSASQRWASMQERPKLVKCYVWPTLYDFDRRVIEKGEVVLSEQSASCSVSTV